MVENLGGEDQNLAEKGGIHVVSVVGNGQAGGEGATQMLSSGRCGLQFSHRMRRVAPRFCAYVSTHPKADQGS
jgi:hypothetical protein